MNPVDADMLQWIDAQDARMRRLVTQWADVNSGSYNIAGLTRMRQMLREAWAPLGGEMVEIDLDPEPSIDAAGNVTHTPLGKALSIRKRAEAPLRVFLCIHMDTVYPADSPFQKCDLLDDNTLRGPGVADAKGGLAIMLVLAEAIERSPLAESIGWEVLINPDEEIGSPGSSPLFETAARRNHVGLLFEPAYGKRDLVSERGGSGTFTAVVYGRSAHAGRDPKTGRNAIQAMAQLIVSLGWLASDNVTLNVGKVEGGGPVNVVPDLAICRFNVRVRTVQQQRDVSAAIERIVAEMNQAEGIRIDLHGTFHRPPKPLDEPTARMLQMALACAGELGLTIGHSRSGGVSDGNQLRAAGLPNLDSLGPRGGRIHSPDEFLLLDSLTERAKLAALLLGRISEDRGSWIASR